MSLSFVSSSRVGSRRQGASCTIAVSSPGACRDLCAWARHRIGSRSVCADNCCSLVESNRTESFALGWTDQTESNKGPNSRQQAGARRRGVGCTYEPNGHHANEKSVERCVRTRCANPSGKANRTRQRKRDTQARRDANDAWRAKQKQRALARYKSAIGTQNQENR